MSDARCYECPNCGGLVREAARLCGYCGSPVATVRCGLCFTLNIPEALHCIGCGAELGLMPIELPSTRTIFCPRCNNVALDAFRSADDALHDCPTCGGQLIPTGAVAALVRRHAAPSGGVQQHVRPYNPLTERLIYIKCPICQTFMLRQNFGKVSGIIVDVCTAHGFWFDRGELPRILAFVSQGGLSRPHFGDCGASRVPATPGPNSLPTATFTDELGGLGWEDMHDAVNGFVRWLQSTFR